MVLFHGYSYVVSWNAEHTSTLSYTRVVNNLKCLTTTRVVTGCTVYTAPPQHTKCLLYYRECEITCYVLHTVTYARSWLHHHPSVTSCCPLYLCANSPRNTPLVRRSPVTLSQAFQPPSNITLSFSERQNVVSVDLWLETLYVCLLVFFLTCFTVSLVPGSRRRS